MSTGSDATLLILDRLSSIDKLFIEERRSSAESRKAMYAKLEETNATIVDMAYRVQKLETAMTDISPTINEFVVYKQQVVGAGRLGRLLWWIGGTVLAAAVAVAGWWEQIVRVFRH